MLYQYRKSRKSVGLRLLLWVAVLYGWLWGLHQMGAPLNSEFMRWSLLGTSVAAAVLIAIAIWNFANPGVFEVQVSYTHFSVHYPGHDRLTFRIPIADIERIEYRTRRDHAGRRKLGHFVITESGREFEITTNYFNAIGPIHRALQQMKPDITLEHKHVVNAF